MGIMAFQEVFKNEKHLIELMIIILNGAIVILLKKHENQIIHFWLHTFTYRNYSLQ